MSDFTRTKYFNFSYVLFIKFMWRLDKKNTHDLYFVNEKIKVFCVFSQDFYPETEIFSAVLENKY